MYDILNRSHNIFWGETKRKYCKQNTKRYYFCGSNREDKAVLYVSLVRRAHSGEVTACITHHSREELKGIHEAIAIGGKPDEILSHISIPLPEGGRGHWAMEAYAAANATTSGSLGLRELSTALLQMVANGTLDMKLLKGE